MNHCDECKHYKEDDGHGYSMGRCMKNVSTGYKIGYVFWWFYCLFYEHKGEGEE